MICPLSPAHFVALGAFQLFIILLFVDLKLAILPLLLFIVSCLIAPFLTGFGYFLPIISKGRKDARGVALTFDDGPDPEVTPRVLELLARHGVQATFFVTGTRTAQFPSLIESILAAGHTVGNHSYHHSPFLMLKGRSTLIKEIDATQQLFARHGIVPLAFRPPVGITNGRLWRVLLNLNMFCVTFSCRGGDMGNRRVKGLAQRLLAKVSNRDILLLHDVTPHQGTVQQLLQEFETLISGLGSKGLTITPLPRLIGKEVMHSRALPAVQNPVELFYNGLAETYDQEQFNSTVALSRNKEQNLFLARIAELFAGADRVLEIGAGTGIFTLTIAGHCREVLAVDISRNMLAVLEEKARTAGITNIKTVAGDIETMPLEGTFSVVCAFVSFEYMADLPTLLKRLAQHMPPGSTIYFTVARKSLFRFFTQIGNAMRQGVWLKAHTRKELEYWLRSAGFEPVAISSHLCRTWFTGGMLLEVVARRCSARQDMATGVFEEDR